MAGFDTTKPRRRASHKAQLAAAAQKQNHGGVGTETVLGAARRSSRRAKDLQSMETVQTTLQQADITTQKRLVEWSDRGNTLVVLRDKIDPRYAQQYAVQTCALRTGRDLEQVTAAVAESEAGATANVLSRKAGAALRKEKGFSKTYKLHRGGPRQKIVRSGAQVRAKRKRDRAVAALPDNLRPTYGSQTTIGHGMRSYATGRGNGGRVIKRPPAKRSRAEIVAQAQTIYPMDRGRYRFKLSEDLWSDWELVCMGFKRQGPRRKPTRYFIFKGPTAKADAEAFAKTMMKWLKDPNRVGPPPQPRKP